MLNIKKKEILNILNHYLKVDLYTLPEMTEKDKAKLKIKTVREKKEEEEKAKSTRRVPFTYNKLMKISKFAPPISSFTTNLKKEFPTIKFH